MELNREQIIKALEICSDETKDFCTGCPFIGNGGCKQSSILKLALSVIKELTEENERLNERLDREACCQYDLCGQIVNLRDDVKYIKAETVQKIQKRLTSDEFYIIADDNDGVQYVDFCVWVEDIAKEILEANDV